MHLNSRQLLMLIFPFIISAVVYFFDTQIVNYAKYLFPVYEEYSNETLSEKTDTYLQIEEKYKLYKDIKDKLDTRETNGQWLAKNLFYKKMDSVVQVSPQDSPDEKEVVDKAYAYKLQIVYPNKKVAIINGIIVREGTILQGAKIIKIENNRVLIQNKKGIEWLHLFK